jgi:hypothetical protein
MLPARYATPLASQLQLRQSPHQTPAGVKKIHDQMKRAAIAT